MDNVKEKFEDVFDYILKEESDFKSREIPLASNWNWSMFKHIDLSYQLKNSQFTKGENSVTAFKRPFKNIILPIANVNYRTEGFDVKDIEVFVDDPENYHLSLLARKFHNKWAIKYSIDTAIDESVESYFDYGLALVKNVNDSRPEVIQPQMIAFCDQTDILSGPICLKHQYTLDQLSDMKPKWNTKGVDMAIRQSRFSKKVSGANDNAVDTPGKYVEVYELHGVFPNSWLTSGTEDYEVEDEGKYTPQLHIVTYYIDQTTSEKQGISLFKGKESKSIFKAVKRDNIYGRACGRGGIEELFHPQIWTNYSEIQVHEMLKATSKIILKTTDKKVAKNNNLKNVENGQIVTVDEGKTLDQLVIQPFNKAAFDNYVNVWEQNARTIGSASDPQLGLNPTSGTPLGTTEIVTSQGEGIHQYRRGKIATFWGEIYRDWVLQYLVDEMNEGDEWLDELTLDELLAVGDAVATNYANDKIKEKYLAGGMVTAQERDAYIEIIKQDFLKGGKQKFLKIMKDEFAELPLEVKFNIAGKQYDLANNVNKLNAIFRAVFANPAVLQAPGMGELFNNILEESGFSPINFTSLTKPPETPPPEQSIESQVPIQSPIQPSNLTSNVTQ